MSVPTIQNYQNIFYDTQKTHHYFYRIPFYSSENKEKTNLLSEDKERLEGYYKKYFSYPVSINSIENFGTKSMEGEGQPNLFVQVQRSDYIANRELEWLKTIKLNQITIDRLLEKKQQDSDLIEANAFKELVKFNEFFPDHSKLARNSQNFEAVDVFLRKAKIPTDEIKRLVYFPSDQIGVKRWFVWLDKEVLRMKLNLGFQIWFFNQAFLRKQKYIKDFFQVTQGKKPKVNVAVKKKIKSMFKQLSEEEKEFFDFYFQEFYLKKENVRLDALTLKPQEISSEELNRIYNLSKEQSKSLSIFKGHLIQVIEGGDKNAFESFFPNYITYASGPDAIYEIESHESEVKSGAKLTITPDRTLDEKWNSQELLDIFKNYSVKHFTLRTKDNSSDQWPTEFFSSTGYPVNHPVIRTKHFSIEKIK
nr:hypothetical protein [Candidatus Mycoplasma haematolamae]